MSNLMQWSATAGLLCLISFAELCGASTAPDRYLIKPRPARDFVDSLNQLRRFLERGYSDEQRCKRQAVVLDTLERMPISQFDIAEIALARPEEINKKFQKIHLEQLRDLYITASRQYLERQHVDESLIELLACLKSGYRNRDARARSFLNERELNRLIDQFQAITRQPLRLLLDGNNAPTGLRLSEFDDSIKQTVNNWIGYDPQKSERLFGSRQSNVPQQYVAQQHPQVSAPAQMSPEKYFRSRAPVMAPTYEQVDAIVADEVQAAIADAAQQVEHVAPQVVNPAASVPVATPEFGEDEDQEYLETVFGSLMSIYESLPPQAGLGDRCQAYNRVIAANRQQVFRDDFVDRLIRQVSARIKSHGPRRRTYRADKKTREDFLFIVEMFDPLRAGPEVWLDLNDCLLNWANVDRDVAKYLNNPEHIELVKQVNAQFEVEGPVYTPSEVAFY